MTEPEGPGLYCPESRLIFAFLFLVLLLVIHFSILVNCWLMVLVRWKKAGKTALG